MLYILLYIKDPSDCYNIVSGSVYCNDSILNISIIQTFLLKMKTQELVTYTYTQNQKSQWRCHMHLVPRLGKHNVVILVWV